MKTTRKCNFCSKSFVTRSGVQKYCSEACQAEAKRARTEQKNNLFKAVRPLMEIQHQEYLTFSKAAVLMGCSRQYIYKLVALGKLKASRISNRMAFIRKTDIERMLEGNPYHRVLPGSTSTPRKSASSSPLAKKEKREKETYEVLDFYSGEEVMSLFKVRQSWLYTTAKRNRIPICRIAGKNYYSKKHVDEFFGMAIDTSNITDWLLIEEAEELFGMKPHGIGVLTLGHLTAQCGGSCRGAGIDHQPGHTGVQPVHHPHKGVGRVPVRAQRGGHALLAGKPGGLIQHHKGGVLI